jgi:hypothetical protein
MQMVKAGLLRQMIQIISCGKSSMYKVAETDRPQPGFRVRFWLSRPHGYFLVLLLVYSLLVLPTLTRQGISWDEQVDLWIARAYLQPGGWLRGTDLDPSQARLPMAVVALVYSLSGREDLLTARWVSASVGALTLLGVYVFACQRLTPIHGLIAVGILATSPFYLSFSRVAFTETDIYLACALTWLLVCINGLLRRPQIGRAALVGLMLGLAISAKFTAVILIPLVWILFLRVQGKSLKAKLTRWTVYFWTGWLFTAVLVIVIFAGSLQEAGINRWEMYGLVFMSWLLPLFWAVWNRGLVTDPSLMAGFAMGFGLLTALLIPPEHLVNIGHILDPELRNSIAWRVENEMIFYLNFAGEAAGLHLLSIILKSTPLIGAGLLMGWGAAVSQRRRPEIRSLILFSGGYFIWLLVLPIAQTFYVIPILPALALLAADGFMRLLKSHRSVAMILAIASIVWCILELVLCYPDYNLNGYQWLGARPVLGRSSIGYRSVVQTPSDGVEQAVIWLNENARAGEIVQVYALPWHIIREAAPEPHYRLVNGFESTLAQRPDYVVVTINATIWQGWHLDTPQREVFRYPFDTGQLSQEYEKIFSVMRAFGIEVASVWKRK